MSYTVKWTPPMLRILLDKLDEHHGDDGLFVRDRPAALNEVLQGLQEIVPHLVIRRKQVYEKLRTLRQVYGVRKDRNMNSVLRQGLRAFDLAKLPAGIYTKRELADKKRSMPEHAKANPSKTVHKPIRSSSSARRSEQSSPLRSGEDIADIEMQEPMFSPQQEPITNNNVIKKENTGVRDITPMQEPTSSPISSVDSLRDIASAHHTRTIADDLQRLATFTSENATFKIHLDRRTIRGTCEHLNECIRTAVLEKLAGASINADRPVVFDFDSYDRELLALLEVVGGAGHDDLLFKFRRIAHLQDHKTLTLSVLLRALIGAAVTEWVFERSPQGYGWSDMDAEVKKSWDELIPNISTIVYKNSLIRYLDTKIEPHLPQEAVRLARRLDNMLTPLATCSYTSLTLVQQLKIVDAAEPRLRHTPQTTYPETLDNIRSPQTAVQKSYFQWLHILQDIFLRALQLRLEMEKDHAAYAFVFPPCESIFRTGDYALEETSMVESEGKYVFMPFMPIIYGSYQYYLNGPVEGNELLSPGYIEFVDTAATVQSTIKIDAQKHGCHTFEKRHEEVGHHISGEHEPTDKGKIAIVIKRMTAPDNHSSSFMTREREKIRASATSERSAPSHKHEAVNRPADKVDVSNEDGLVIDDSDSSDSDSTTSEEKETDDDGSWNGDTTTGKPVIPRVHRGKCAAVQEEQSVNGDPRRLGKGKHANHRSG